MPGTVRERIRLALLEEACDTRAISQRAGVSERDVAEHLEHLDRSLKHRDERLVIEAPRCLECGFEFTERRRFTRPSGCPSCGSRRISAPKFRVESKQK